MSISAWSFVNSFESNLIIEPLLEGEGNKVVYDMDPPSHAEPGGTVLHLSCNTLSIPHIAYLSQKVLEAMGIRFTSLGGSENCCGAPQWERGDEDTGHQAANLSLGAFRRVKPTRVVSTCPDCDLVFHIYMAKSHRFQHTNMLELIGDEIERLKPLMKNRINKKVVLHYHRETDGRRADYEAMRKIMETIPGLEILDAEHSCGSGNHCIIRIGNRASTLHEAAIKEMFEEASELQADTLVVPYHGCYRQHLKRQLQYPVEVVHYLELVADAIGIQYDNKLKKLRLLDDIEEAMATVRDRGIKLGYSEREMRSALESKVYV